MYPLRNLAVSLLDRTKFSTILLYKHRVMAFEDKLKYPEINIIP